MASEISFSRSFFKVLQERFGAATYGYFRSILDTVFPVVVVGRDFSDNERPAWGISGDAAQMAGHYSSFTITSAVDIGIEAIAFQIAISTGLLVTGPLVMLTPDVTWIPFAVNPTYTYPGVRPRLEFDPSRTILIHGYNPNPPPFWGFEFLGNVNYDSVTHTNQSYYDFDPPWILPAGMFFTWCQPFANGTFYDFSIRYREIG